MPSANQRLKQAALIIGMVVVFWMGLSSKSALLLSTKERVSSAVRDQVVRTATLVVCASNARNTTQCDYLADGVTDNVEIQAAIDALPAGGGKIVLSEGVFNITDSIRLPSKAATIEGLGRSVTAIRLADGANVSLFKIAAGQEAWNTSLRDFLIDGNKANNNSGYGMDLTGFHGLVENVYIGDTAAAGIYADGTIINSNSMHLINVTVAKSASHGFNFKSIWGLHGTLLFASQNGQDGFLLETGGEYFLDNFSSDFSGRYGMMVSNVSNSSFNTFWIGDSGDSGLRVEGGSLYNSFSNGHIYHPLRARGNSSAYLSNVQYSQFTNITVRAEDATLSQGWVVVSSINLLFSGGLVDTQSLAFNFSNENNNKLTVRDISVSSTNPFALAAGKSFVIKNVYGYPTVSSGEVTITAGKTSVNVTHGLATTPTRVQITPTTDTFGKRFWVSVKNPSTFTITLDSAHTSDIFFDWRATVGEDN